jgi:hypothetical protein
MFSAEVYFVLGVIVTALYSVIWWSPPALRHTMFWPVVLVYLLAQRSLPGWMKPAQLDRG